jgi:glycosyltransferase involved in cell wall biosynthesis
MTTAESWPALSVIVAVRNGLPEVREQLAAVCAQRYPGSWELVIVDDGSTDGSRPVLEHAVTQAPAGRVVDGPSQGMPSARIAGARASSGDVLIFLDHDDVIAPGYLQAMGTSLRTHAFAAARVDIDALNPVRLRSVRPPQQTSGLAFEHWPFGSGGTLAIRRETYERLGGHDPRSRSAEDRDLCFRAAQSNVELVFVPDAVLRYRYRSTPWAIYRQARRGANSDVWLFGRHGALGYPPRSVKAELLKLAGAARMMVVGAARRDRSMLCGGALRLGRGVGHCEGCITQRVRYLRWNLASNRRG